jgi:hypothetical protein
MVISLTGITVALEEPGSRSDGNRVLRRSSDSPALPLPEGDTGPAHHQDQAQAEEKHGD